MLRRGGNVIRWRWARGPGGERVPLSNARLVRWSDGTESVMLGDQVGSWTVEAGSRMRGMQGLEAAHREHTDQDTHACANACVSCS